MWIVVGGIVLPVRRYILYNCVKYAKLEQLDIGKEYFHHVYPKLREESDSNIFPAPSRFRIHIIQPQTPTLHSTEEGDVARVKCPVDEWHAHAKTIMVKSSGADLVAHAPHGGKERGRRILGGLVEPLEHTVCREGVLKVALRCFVERTVE